MASEELAAVHDLLRGFDLGDLAIAERRAVFESVAAPPPPGTTVEPADAGGVPAEWVIAAGVDTVRVLLYLHGGAYQASSRPRRGAWSRSSRRPRGSACSASATGWRPSTRFPPPWTTR